MKNIVIAFLPLLFAGFILPDDSCRQNTSSTKNMNVAQNDGPYVLYRGDKIYVKYILDNNGTMSAKQDSLALTEKGTISLTVQTDEPGKTFSVKLKPQLQNEEAEFTNVTKQFILSDIEGNFRAFRKLLQANKVIDESFNWTFGNGHLVLTGDFFDRGDQVTETLWLIYSLEEKAKAAGGYVHFVLGNHEIMNLSGDIRYVVPKYFQNAALINENYMMLYSENSELGRWLRTKNIMEKIGDILFIHGGISAAVNSMNIPVSAVSNLARPYYADSTNKYNNTKLDTLFSDLGPFWYRGYYTGSPKANSVQVDSTLSIYGVKHIATGHTIIADTISVLYNGKLFNTDVHHVIGHSEALLFEDGKYYRVNPIGEKLLILE